MIVKNYNRYNLDDLSLFNRVACMNFNNLCYLCRVFALLDVYLDDRDAALSVLETSPDLLPKLFTLAGSIGAGERQIVMENHCEELRALFKEYVRPVHHELSTEKRRSNMPCQFDITREFPLVFGCVFLRELTSVHYVCDPGDNAPGKQPRGALIFADKPFPERVSYSKILENVH